MKKKIKIITSYFPNKGFGNLYRCINLYKFLKKKHKVEYYLFSSDKDYRKIKKKYKFINKLKNLNISKYDHFFVDFPNIKKKFYRDLTKLSQKILFYGNSNYFSHNNQKIYPFKNNFYNMSYAIINNDQNKIKYNFKKNLIFFIYFGKAIKVNIIKKILVRLSKFKFIKKIEVFYPKKIIFKKSLFKNKKIKYLNDFKEIKNNVIFIGNSGSGAYDRVNSGVLSMNYSYNKNEKLIGKKLSKFKFCFNYMGDINKFNLTKFEKILINILNNRGKNSFKTHGIFKNNNVNIEKTILK